MAVVVGFLCIVIIEMLGKKNSSLFAVCADRMRACVLNLSLLPLL